MSKRIKKETNNQRINSKFGQDRKRHSKRGVTSCLFAVTGVSVLTALFTMAYRDYGNGNTLIGAAAVLILILSGIGISTGLKGFREREKNYISCKIGVVINGFLATILCLLYLRGIS